MTIYEFDGKSPAIDDSSYVHEHASVIGDVSVGAQCFVGAGAVLRGDYGRLKVGQRTSIQENSVLHARPDESCIIGNDVQVGHGAILHNCTVRDFAVVGLGSRICDYSIIGIWAIIGEGAVVNSKSNIPDGKVAVGVPAKVIRDVNDEEMKLWSLYKRRYVELAQKYKTTLKMIRS